MKILLVTLVTLFICGVTSALTCYKCEDQISNDQCTLNTSTVECNATGQQCYVFKMPVSNKITKGCKSKDLCAAISVGNLVGYSLAYCCSTELCNANGGLTCYKCEDQISNDQCTLANSTVDCNANDAQCYASKNLITNKITKGCSSKEECAAIPAVNSAGLTNSYCCNTTRCNTNGILKCYKCDDQISNDQCTMANSTVDCSAPGQQCYANKNPITKMITKGCGSREACAAISTANEAGLNNSYCCNTDHCNKNGASTLAPSLITSAPLMAASIMAALVTSTRLAVF